MLQAHFYRFPKRFPGCLHLHNRRYSVRIPNERHRDVRTVADLKAWQPGQLGQLGPTDQIGTGHHVSDVEVCGWVRSVRKSSGVRFVDITDGSSMRPLQAVVDKSLAADVRPGTAVRLRGTWHTRVSLPPSASPEGENLQASLESRSPPPSRQAPEEERNGSARRSGKLLSDGSPDIAPNSAEPTSAQLGDSADAVPSRVRPSSAAAELQATSVEIFGPSDPQSYPIQNKYQTPESLRAISHLRPRTPLNSTMLRLRSDAIALLTKFFFEKKFQQTHPPIITSSDCEGAGEAFTVKAGGGADFFRNAKYLTVSTQLHLEALAQALGNVWTLSPTFRAEQSDTSRHLSEFYMLEAEMMFVQDMDEVMDLVQDMLSSLVRGLSSLSAAQELDQNRLDAKDPAERLAFRDLADRTQLQRRWEGMTQHERWPRLSYTEAVEMLQSASHLFEHEPVWGAGLQSEHEKYLAEKVGFDEEKDAYLPVFVTHYPRATKAFYMRRSAGPPAQGETVDCFDLLVPDLGELAGGSMREHRLGELEDNMRLHGLSVPGRRDAGAGDLGWYVDLRRWGCPPHGGFGLGFDRLLSYLTGVHNIRDVVPFPRHYERCDC